ncbi:MAG: SUMF1/EgtB/PvdO family nonheme iron enzyme [Bacteroidales bacterium]|jgi:gliding motility-associated lipoprotein GldK|nr:SUMF1/EgtB/PvdO family nonheme iron enzyme [Bacteroidales bacterium]
MKRVLYIGFIVTLLLQGCGSYNGGELVGISGRSSFEEPEPHGMVRIPMGSFTMGQNDDDINWAFNQSSKTVSVPSFWMDDTEITNNEYRQFVYWVKDSLIRKELADRSEEYRLFDRDDNELVDKDDKLRINWDAKIDFDNDEVKDVIEEFVYQPKDRLFGKKEFDTRKLVYRYYWIDINLAAKARNMYDAGAGQYNGYWVDDTGNKVPITGREDFIKEGEVHVYPDTLVWVRDFTYSYNDPHTNNYFSHPTYDQYPVVGVNWKQARAFCAWRTDFLNASLRKQGNAEVSAYRLPLEAEWEYAARGGIDLGKYPWGGPYLRNVEGCLVANFKPMRGNYVDDGGYKTVPVGSYEPNGYGLFDMAGNVSEWSANAYDETTYNFSHDMSPGYVYQAKKGDSPSVKRKVIRGGSWKDVGYFLECGVRAYEYQDSAKSYIGFRCVRDLLGENSIY